MPKTASAKKAFRQNIRRQAKNLAKKQKLKAVIKQHKKLIAAKQTEEAKKYLPMVYKTLDKAAKANLIKKNKANRLKSRLAKKLKSN